MTIVVAQAVTANSTTGNVQIPAGRYMFAAGGNFDGATMTFEITVGPSVDVPVTEMQYTAPKADIVWLPACTCHVVITAAGASTNVNGALALVALDVM